MLPQNTYSTVPVPSRFLPPADYITTPLVDYEEGGVGLLDTSQGLQVQIWKAWLEDDLKIMVKPENGPATELFQATQVSELSLCFDQNMRWSIGFVQAGVLKLNWFDTSVGQRVITTFEDVKNPKMTLDDKRPSQLPNSDMILAYIKGNSLCYRQQRDRFTIEYLLRANLFPGTKLKAIGMGVGLRMQFELV